MAWSILKDVQDQKHIINFVWPYHFCTSWYNHRYLTQHRVGSSICGIIMVNEYVKKCVLVFFWCLCVCVCACVCVCMCPAGVRGWLVISFKSLSLLPAGGAFGRMKTGTLSSLPVKAYLSASTTGINKYDLGISLSDS